MPRIFERAILNMFSLSPDSIVLFEPVPEVWPHNLRGLVSRLRVKAIDRLHNLPEAITRLIGNTPGYRLVGIQRSGLAINPHTEMCKVGSLNRSEEHTSELQSLMRLSYAVFCLNKKKER